MTPEQRSLRARQAAYAMHARHDSRATTAKAQQAAYDRFDREVDPDGALSPEERTKRADAARRAHMLGMAAKSARLRRERSRPIE